MLVIIEGPDNTGKTTLAKKLVEKFDLEYIHCSKPKTDNPYLEYCDLADSIKKPTVLDRAHLGEYVYGRLWRGGCDISDAKFSDLDFKFMDKFEHVIVVHATAPLDVILERCRANDEKLLKEDQIKRCVELFDDVISKTDIPVLTYNSDVEKPEDIVEQIWLMTSNIG